MTSSTPFDDLSANSTAAIAIVIQPKAKDLGGFSVRRSIPVKERRAIGPWVFFDEMGPAQFAAGDGINVRPHPHINLATVTYLFQGEILHRDSLGSYQAIRPGDINLMVAGKGIVHSERQRPEVTAQPHSLHGLQLWLALPEADEEIAPAFYHYPAEQIPALTVDGVSVKVLIGEAYNMRSPVKTYFDTLYLEADLAEGQQLVLPDAAERGLYVCDGAVQIADQCITKQQLAVLQPVTHLVVTAEQASRIALIGGERIPPRFMEWNFVSSSKARIAEAKADWAGGRFAKVPGDETEFIPLPE